MLVYYLLVFLPVFLLLWVGRERVFFSELLWVIFFLAFVFIIGFRDNVGADWNAYIRHYELTQGVSMIEAIQTTDSGYAFLNWISALVSGGIYLVNLICAALVLSCLIHFARGEPTPWFFISVSVFFYIIIIGMSLSRQAVAIGFELMAIRAILDKRAGLYIFYIVCAALFHKTALILLPLYSVINSERGLNIIALFAFLAIGAALVVLEAFSSFYYYIEDAMESQGAIFRSIYLSVPGILFFFYRKKLQISDVERKLGTVLSFLAVGSLGVGFISLTAVDRLLLYLTPLPPMVFTKLMTLLRGSSLKLAYGIVVIIFHIVMLYLWLNYSNNSMAWIPYQNVLIN